MKMPPEIKTIVPFVLDKQKKLYLRQEILSCEHKGKKYTLCSTGGLGGCSLILSVDGKNYIADLRPMMESLINVIDL